MTNAPDDDDLRRMIARADPSASLHPLRSDQLTRLTETTINRKDTIDGSRTRPARTTRRAWALGGGGVGIAAIAAAAFIVPGTWGPATSSTTLNQPAGGGPAAMCAEVTPDALAGYDSAFRAVVTTVEGDMVTLTVSDTFKGDIDKTVMVPQGDGGGVDGEPLVFADGGTYLISTQDGTIVTCGVSGQDTPELDALYRQAFAR